MKLIPQNIFVVLLLVTVAAHAQPDENLYKHISVKDGLGSSTISSIVQDQQGYIWIGTHFGWARYDGTTVRNYIHTTDPASLPMSKVFRIIPLSGSRLAALTDEGFQVLNTKTGTSKNYSIPDTTAWFTYCNKIYDLLPVSDSSFFVSTATGFYWFHIDGRIIWRYDAFSASDMRKVMRYGRLLYSLPGNKIICFYGEEHAKIFDCRNRSFIEVDSSQQLFPSTLLYKNMVKHGEDFFFSHYRSDSLFHYNTHTRRITATALPVMDTLEMGWPGQLVFVNDSLLIQTSGTNGYFFVHYNQLNHQLILDTTRYFANTRCWAMLVDKAGRMWIGTSHGLYMKKIAVPAISTTTIAPLDDMLPNKTPHFNGMMRQGNSLYVHGSGKQGILVFDANTMKQKKHVLFPDNQREVNDILTVMPFSKDTLWVGTLIGLRWYKTSNGHSGAVNYLGQPLTRGSVNSGMADKHRNIWISGGNQIFKYQPATRLFTKYLDKDSAHYLPIAFIKFVTEDADGNIWAAGNGLSRYNYQKDSWDTMITTFAGYRKYESNVLGLTADTKGNLWVATASNGLLCYDIKQRTWQHFNSGNGLSSDLVYSLALTHENRLFIATGSDINLLDLNTRQFFVFNQKDGLPDKEMSSGFYYDSVSKRLWAVYDNEIAAIPTSRPSQKWPTPKLTIEQISIADDTTFVFPEKKVNVSWQHPNVTVRFTKLDFDDAEAGVASFRLQPKDQWQAVGAGSTILLSNLKAGDYQLEIKLHSTAARWADQTTSLHITVHPPFWKTAWFILLCCVIFIVAIYGWFRKRIRQVGRKAAVDRQLADYEFKALHAQMNPHFLFNCLNSIKELIVKQDNDGASRYLSLFAQLIRDTLEESKLSFVTLQQTVDYLRRYIEMEQLRFDDFTATINIDPALPASEINIPPMLIQPLIENAIWHGLRRKNGGRQLIVEFSEKEDWLLCRVTDDGIGINQAQAEAREAGHVSNGLENIRKRLALLQVKYGMQGRLQLKDRSTADPQTQGTMAELWLTIDKE
ncbi:MAG: histidine kinase [Chitinophagaceae bacterium]